MNDTTHSLATGAELTPQSWADFVARLTHDHRGDGAARHLGADPIFTVQAKRYTYGVDLDFNAEKVILADESVYLSEQDYYENGLDDEGREALDAIARKCHEAKFLELGEFEQRLVLQDMEGVTVTGRTERWDYVSAHLTQQAADAFIARKAHDYRDGLRVYVDSQYYSWEFNTIVNAIMDGRLVLKSPELPTGQKDDLITDSDVYTLIGHAEQLKSLGQKDLPDYFYTLAARLAGNVGDAALQARVIEMQSKA